MTRFFAHLCLFLQLIDIPVPPLATQIILEAYLQVLEVRRVLVLLTQGNDLSQAAGQRNLIAMYAGALGDNAVDRYAMFLTSLELSADSTERKEALIRARDHGLDMQRVATATAERTIEKVFRVRILFLILNRWTNFRVPRFCLQRKGHYLPLLHYLQLLRIPNFCS
jgi:nuclear pore complex protein Nup107